MVSVTIGNSATNIGDRTFAYCSRLTAVTVAPLNANYSSIDGILFNKGQSLLILCPGDETGGVTITNSVTNIGEYALQRCSGLTNISIGNSVAGIAGSAFAWCSGLTTITLPDSVTSIGESAFEHCPNLTSVTAPNSVTSIGDWAFSDCLGLARVTIGNSVTSIGSYAFYNCAGLTGVTIGSSVTSIGWYAFLNCFNLNSMFFRGNAPYAIWAPPPSGGPPLGYPTISYYLPGTSGWEATYCGQPAYLLNPAPQTSGPSFGVGTNGFGFNITGTADIPIVVEASTNLTAAAWVPLQSCTLTNGLIYFSDPAWTNFPTRAYRIRSP